jgi:transcription factor IIIB subunit 2
MPDSIDQEIDSMFRNDEEVAQKEAIFNKINKDYILQQERKELDRVNVEVAVEDKDKEGTAQAEAHARYKSNRNRKNRGAGGETGEPTTEEQLMAAVSNRKVSRKINYDALSSIFDEEGSFSTDVVGDSGPNEDQMYGAL